MSGLDRTDEGVSLYIVAELTAVKRFEWEEAQWVPESWSFTRLL
jgi:hypothetical protein